MVVKVGGMFFFLLVKAVNVEQQRVGGDGARE